jgi:hypothetical protein
MNNSYNIMAALANVKELETIITEELAPQGFRKKGQNWYYRTDDCVCMFNLDKSRWGGQFFLNLGVMVSKIDPTETPLEYRCHVRCRIDDIIDDSSLLEKALNLEDHSIPADEKIKIIQESIRKAGPILKSLGTLDAVKKIATERIATEHPHPIWGIHKDVLAFFFPAGTSNQ